MELKKFNEEYERDGNFDYEGKTEPITKEAIIDFVTQELEAIMKDAGEEFVLTEKMKADINQFANRKIYGLWDQVNYMIDDNGEEFWSIIDGTYK